MTTSEESRFLSTLATWRGRSRGLLVLGGIALAGSLVQGCGSSDELSCGKGTEKKGKECVASSSLSSAGGVEGGVPDATAPNGTGGQSDRGGSGGAGGEETGDSGSTTEKITFSGITAAAAANRTPANDANATPDSIRLTWKPASYPLRPLATIHYEIFESQVAGAENFSTPFDTAPAGSTSYVVQDRTPGKTYYYVVRAVANEGLATDTNTVEKSASPAFDDSPPVPADTGTDATAAGPTSMTVSWSPASDDQTPAEGLVYQVFWMDKSGGAPTLGAVSDPGATSVVVTGLPAADTDYYFVLHAVDAAGNVDDNKNEFRGTTGSDTTPPVFGGCRSVTDVSASTAIVTWDDAVDDTTTTDKITYTVYASDVPIEKGQSLKGLDYGTFQGQDASGKPVRSGRVTGLNASTVYRFVCRATDAKNNEDTNLVIQTGQTSNDGEPPTFAGLTTAVAESTKIDLTWAAAADNLTLPKDIRYRVYGSLTAGNQDFANPIAISSPGVPQITVLASNLLLLTPPGGKVSNTTYFLVVRAADGAGNVDDNKIEKQVTTLVSFKDDVQPVFSKKCALVGCHGTQNPDVPPMQGQTLMDGAALDSIINVTANEGKQLTPPEPNLVRVFRPAQGVVIPTDPSLLASYQQQSYMYRKVSSTGTRFGSPVMPPATSEAGPLSDDEKAAVLSWITQGAQEN
jgi:hypothetical protein